MTLSRRHLFAVTGGALAVAGLSACSPTPGAQPSSPSATSAAPSSPGASWGASPSTGPAKPALAVWHRPTGEPGAEAALVRWAADYPDAAVTVSAPADYEAATRAALAGSSGPDVFEWSGGPTLEMIRGGQVADLTGVVGAARAAFEPGVLDRLTFDGKLWAVPQRADVELFYYRKSWLAKAGLQPPTTLAELVTATNALAAPGRGGLYAGADGGLAALGGLLIWSAGLDQVTPDGRAAAFNEADLHAAVAAYRALLASPGLLRTASTDWRDATPFIENECALQWGGLWDLPRVLAAHAGDVGVLPFPAAGAGGRQVVPVTASCVSVSTRAADRAAAEAYVRALWVDDTAKQLEYATAHGCHLPAKPGLFGQASRLATGPGADATRFTVEFGRSDSIYWTPACEAAFATALSDVAKDGKNVAAAFAAAAARVTAELLR